MDSANIPKPFGMRVSCRTKCYLKKLSKLRSLLLKKDGYRDTSDKATEVNIQHASTYSTDAKTEKLAKGEKRAYQKRSVMPIHSCTAWLQAKQRLIRI